MKKFTHTVDSILNSRIIKFYYTAGKEGQEKEYEANILMNGGQLATVAKCTKEKNLGRPMEIPELNPEIWNYLMEKCEEDFELNHMQGGRIEDYNVCIDFDMPEELVYACERINCMDSYLDVDFYPQKLSGESVTVNMVYTVEHNGETLEESVEYDMSKEMAEVMKIATQLKPLGVTDFDFMQEVAPKAYAVVYDDMKTWCNNKHLEDWKEVVEVTLSDFPKEIVG